ncbi:hypothetical protein HK104_000549 [Borealophlyctis nickersoniae]|nr:hypothetical protein HK104_000549 [Borealophlyctis nickersoniae]
MKDTVALLLLATSVAASPIAQKAPASEIVDPKLFAPEGLIASFITDANGTRPIDANHLARRDGQWELKLYLSPQETYIGDCRGADILWDAWTLCGESACNSATQSKTCNDWNKFTGWHETVDVQWTLSAFHRNWAERDAMVKGLLDTASDASDASGFIKQECVGDPTVGCTNEDHWVHKLPQTIQMDLRDPSGAMISQMKSVVTPAPTKNDCSTWVSMASVLAGKLAGDFAPAIGMGSQIVSRLFCQIGRAEIESWVASWLAACVTAYIPRCVAMAVVKVRCQTRRTSEEFTFHKKSLRTMPVPFVAAEALSVLTATAVLTEAERHVPSGPKGSVLAGTLAGLAISGIAGPLDHRYFPETRVERLAIPPHVSPFRVIFKNTVGWAAFYTVYKGLSTGVNKARRQTSRADAEQMKGKGVLEDFRWHFTNFFAGGVGGLTYRAATFPLYESPVENPLFLKESGPRLMAGSLVGMGLLAVGLGVAEVYWGEWRDKKESGPADLVMPEFKTTLS